MLHGGKWSQEDQRDQEDPNTSGRFFYDNHGRKYHAEVEIKTNTACGPYVPAGWDAPIYPQQKYLKPARGRRAERAVGYDLEIDYPTWLADVEEGWKSRQEHLAFMRRENPHLPDETLLYRAGKPKLHPRIVHILMTAEKPYAEMKQYLLGAVPFDPTHEGHLWADRYLNPMSVGVQFGWGEDDIPVEASPLDLAPADPRADDIPKAAPVRPKKPVGV